MKFYRSTDAQSALLQCRHNEKYILNLLRKKRKESKANLARDSGLTAAAVGDMIKQLSAKGLVEEVGKVQGDMGQPATLYAPAKNGAYGLGVSISRSFIQTLIVDFGGNIVAEKKHHLILPAPEEVFDLLLKDIAALCEPLPSTIQERIVGLGVAQPFNISVWEKENSNWRDWDSFDLARLLGSALNMPSFKQNDVNAAALAEMMFREDYDVNEFMYLFFGSSQVQSLGGGLILDGDCRTGSSGNAGDFGLLPVPRHPQVNWASDAGGETTYLTNRCSFYSLVRFLKAEGVDLVSGEPLHEVLSAQPVLVNVWLEQCVAALASGVLALQALVDVPELVIDCEDDDAYLVDRIISLLTVKLADVIREGVTLPKIAKGVFGSNASAIGAATLPFDAFFSPKVNGNTPLRRKGS
ncbi:ROK family protein [Teredinibacter turnerae T7901]|uniref:ROK family protein n=1 Tax=Teredinibacter turnerae (strain ATCC 39867 / T7901) TaxID=377629 RepID=C5BUF3_TERTT|nr:ROK family transcriptional regulator [Teredinibacter turnerae]ACR12820.1 ROK family protein [Teredinibacter turnerae T7901]